MHLPFYIGAAAVALGIGVLATGHSLLAEAERVQAAEASGHAPAEERRETLEKQALAEELGSAG
ncbi:hypothetical protein SVIO_100830 [Streptomyces violaceusniger]|uniref:Uncharacterized protein n=1 Tax=Streptomyces violaceusniger TaxID=68280 RepID=A0A4D4LJQ8_STRVO|nr:hypothetical protein SVIO_100830 [Streptomyces violaceusniger]